MLKQRVVTALLLAVGFVAALLLSSWLVLAVAVGGIVVLGAWEWGDLAGLSKVSSRVAYCAALVLGALTLGYFTDWAQRGDRLLSVFSAAGLWWALALLWVQSYPASAVLWGGRSLRLLMGACVLLPAWLACLYLRAQPLGVWLVFFVVLLVAAADIGAYFSGRTLGRHKLAPAVSPGKSWEGVIGGAVAALVVATGFYLVMSGQGTWLSMILVALPAALISVLGDLLESMVKRHRGVKDSSQLLPGHGGVLDRIDGLLAALPIFALGYLMSPWRL